MRAGGRAAAGLGVTAARSVAAACCAVLWPAVLMIELGMMELSAEKRSRLAAQAGGGAAAYAQRLDTNLLGYTASLARWQYLEEPSDDEEEEEHAAGGPSKAPAPGTALVPHKGGKGGEKDKDKEKEKDKAPPVERSEDILVCMLRQYREARVGGRDFQHLLPIFARCAIEELLLPGEARAASMRAKQSKAGTHTHSLVRRRLPPGGGGLRRAAWPEREAVA